MLKLNYKLIHLNSVGTAERSVSYFVAVFLHSTKRDRHVQSTNIQQWQCNINVNASSVCPRNPTQSVLLTVVLDTVNFASSDWTSNTLASQSHSTCIELVPVYLNFIIHLTLPSGKSNLAGKIYMWCFWSSTADVRCELLKRVALQPKSVPY